MSGKKYFLLSWNFRKCQENFVKLITSVNIVNTVNIVLQLLVLLYFAYFVMLTFC